MATSKINSDSSSDYSIPTEDFLIKLRKNLDGVALSHDSLDNNWEVLRRTVNDLIEEVDEITVGDLSNTTTENLFVNKIADDVIQTSHLKNDAVTGAKIADNSIVTAHIQSQNITTDLIADGSITSAKIASGSSMDFSNGISVGGVQVVDESGNITGPVTLSAQQQIDLKGEKGDSFEYGDFKDHELEALRGPPGKDSTEPGPPGPPGPAPTFSFSNGTLTITNTS